MRNKITYFDVILLRKTRVKKGKLNCIEHLY